MMTISMHHDDEDETTEIMVADERGVTVQTISQTSAAFETLLTFLNQINATD